MSLRLIYGRAGTGKTSLCLEEMKSRIKGGSGRLLLVVPEQFSLVAEMKLVKAIGASGINNVEVLSFRRMAYRVFNEVGGIAKTHVTSAGKCMMLYRTLDELSGALKVFGKAAAQKGFVNTLGTMISELKRYRITPEDLQKSGEVLQTAGEGLAAEKLQDIEKIYREFEYKLHQHYLDSDDDLSLLADRLLSSTQFDGAEIWMDEFSGFTPQEYAVIQRLLQKSQRVNITLCTDCLWDDTSEDGTDVFYSIKRAAIKLERIAKASSIPIEKPVNLNNGFSKYAEELKHLERSLITYGRNQYHQDTSNVSVFVSSNPHTEVEDTARRILKLCREKKIRYNQIAVITGNLPMYEKYVRVIFHEYGIPCFIDRKRDINGHPLVLLINSALQVFLKNWSYEAVFRYLKTGLTGIALEEIDFIENYVLASGIRGSHWTGGRAWEFGITELEAAKVNKTKTEVSKPLMNLHGKIKGRKPAREVCTALFDFLCELGIPERIEKMVQDFKEAGKLDLANEYGQIWNIAMEVLDQIAEVMDNEVLGVDKLSKMLEIGFGEYKIGLIPAAQDSIFVGNIERSKSHEVKAVFILGANEGTFPTTVKDEGILTDKDREKLRNTGVELAQDTRSRTFEQQYLVYTALTLPTELLHLSYSIADSGGATLRPSSVIAKIRRFFPKLILSSNIVRENKWESELEYICAPAPTFNELVSALRLGLEGYEVNEVWKSAFRWFQTQAEWKSWCDQVLSGFEYTNQVELIKQDKVKRLYGSSLFTSVSRLEKYISCPFAYYVEHGLKAKERKVQKLNAPDVGTFIHEVIDAFSLRLAEEGIKWRELDTEWCKQALSDIVDDMVNNMSNSVMTSTKRYAYLTARLKRVLVRAVLIIAEHIKRSGFEPLGYEMAFGFSEKLPPITVELPSGDKIILNGRIDRIDVMKTEEGTYVRVIDYKSGNKAFKLSDVYYGLSLQLTAYLDAIWENGIPNHKKPIYPAGMLYFKIDDPYIRNRGISPEEVEREIMKQLKMKGLLLADVKLIKEMDRAIEGDSIIIPARINKDGELGRSSAASLEKFTLLRDHVRKLMVKIGSELQRGNISINPYKKKGLTSCTYCNYMAICQFDTSLKGNAYRILTDRKDDEVWTLLESDMEKKGEEL